MISVASFSEPGGHPTNEDAFLVDRHPSDPECWLCVLADGQGGRAGGAKAAQLACRVALEAAKSETRSKLATPNRWASLLSRADEAVRNDEEAGLTTLIGFCIVGATLIGASCGDSAVLLLSAEEKARQVTAGQQKNPPVGSGAAYFVPFGARLTPPWTVMAMSDGVWKFAGWENILETAAAAHGQQIIDELQRRARLSGSGAFADDFSVVLFESAT